MPTCPSCQSKWNWKQTMKAWMTFDHGLCCPICHQKQFPTRKTRTYSFFLSIIPSMALVLLLFDVPARWAISYLIISALIVLMIYPFTLTLTEDEKIY
ncbi:TIGR04104 family putative zinc finger protein [Gracilibacillus timonensis]|uniref:TIGR04104 family putative zinc finger protein n=1 Tax=Gracilibacillus timonensis TaxID=1816696 RepID=UPI000825C39C|nr:TIGR04104 family putative zinc finger protein [Gracilibacillus timonensis]